MADLSNLSDEELVALYTRAKSSKPAANPDENLGGTMSVFGRDTGIKISPEVEAALVAAGKGATRMVQGGKDLYYGASNQPEKQAELKRTVEQENAIYAPLAEKYPKATFAGELTPYMAIPGGPLASASAAFVEYGTPGERVANAGLAYGGGKIAQGLARMFGPATMAKGANKWDIPLTTGQATHYKPAQIGESVLEQVPFGGTVRKARDESMGAWWRAVTKQFGKDSTKITPELLGAAKNEMGKEIGAIAARNAINIDPPLYQGVNSAIKRAQSELTEDEAKIVLNQIDEIWKARRLDPQGNIRIPGEMYKAVQSKLGQIAKNRGGTVADILGDLRTTLREAMTRSVSPEDSAAWLKANERYFNVQQVAEAAKRTPGEMSPAALLAQINKAQKSSKFGGGNELAELARFGQQFLGEKIPNSGTAQRAFYQKLLSNPATGIGGLLGADYVAGQLGVDYGPEKMAATAAVPLAMSRLLAGKPLDPATRRLLTEAGGGLFATAF